MIHTIYTYTILYPNTTIYAQANQETLSAAKAKMKESERSFQTMERTYEATKADYNAIDHELQKYTQVCRVAGCVYLAEYFVVYTLCYA